MLTDCFDCPKRLDEGAWLNSEEPIVLDVLGSESVFELVPFSELPLTFG
jgi:hypothetical protein